MAVFFELTDLETNSLYAGKVIPKSGIRKKWEQARLMNEITIHKSLKHKNIIEFVDHFEDDRFHYIILELCTKKSMKELMTRRRTLTEPQIAYFVKEIAEAIQCIHNALVIHHDIKLSNIFISDEMVPKVGDFGLSIAVKDLNYPRYAPLGCPPNAPARGGYVGPEIFLLNSEDYTFGVDVWALGDIAYTLAVGRPPFEKGSMKDTYQSIKKGDFDSSLVTSPHCRDFILNTVQVDERKRLTIDHVLKHPFLNAPFYIPRPIPLSCLTTPPIGDQ